MPNLSAPFAVREFRALWFGRGFSLLGDQLARVAIAVLVYHRTHSAALTGLVYGLTFLPYLAGPLMAGIADRRSRRGLMIALDVARALLVAAMALPGMPLPAMCALLIVATGVSPLYDSARSALTVQTLPADIYPTGLAVMTMTTETAQVLGFAFGGALVATVGARTALAVDALTYALTAWATVTMVMRRPTPPAATRESHFAALRTAAGIVFRSRQRRALLALAWLNAVWVVPEGLAAPYAAHLHRGSVAVGLLMASMPAGCFIGAVVLGRWVPQETRLRLMWPMAVLCGLALLVCATHPGLEVSLVAWAVCGLGGAYNIAANAAFVQGLPDERRAQGIAFATTGIVAGQGLAILLAGVVASIVSPAMVIAGSGAFGLAIAVFMGLRSRVTRVIVLPTDEPPPAASRASELTLPRQRQDFGGRQLSQRGAGQQQLGVPDA